ncbi:hypothetical protein [Thermoflexus hugenholtzii]
MKKRPKRILLLGAGGPPGINVIRSWREAPEPFYIVGTDMNPFHLEWVPADRVYLVPPVDHPDYLDAIAEIVEREEIDLIHAQPDVEVRALSENRERFPARVFLPRKETVRLLQDKQASAERWRQAGIHTFPTVPVETPEDLERAVEIIGLPLWLRAREGAGARGATLVERIETGIHWIAYWRSRGVRWEFIAQPYFSGREFAWQSLWKDGRLIVSQGRQRIEYIYPHLAPSGRTGTSAVTVTVHDERVNEVATRCVLAVDPQATGVFSVDLMEDERGNLFPTEINAGRFFTTTYFYTRAGCNMPYYMIRLAFDEPLPELPPYNALPAGLYWIRHIDCPAVLVPHGALRVQREPGLTRCDGAGFLQAIEAMWRAPASP